MKKLLLILSIVGLTGCYQSVNQTDLKKAVTYCGSVDKIEYIHVHMDGDEFTKCSTRINWINLDKVVVNE